MSPHTRANRPMRALRAHRQGGPEQLVYEQAPRPPLGIGDLTLRERNELLLAAGFAPAFGERPLDDPELRRPDLTLARRELAWEPTVSLGDGLATTLEWARLHWYSNV